jgi:flagella basal body P-ring formation protein FlgA
MTKLVRHIFFFVCFFIEFEVEAEPFTKISVEKSLVAEIMQKVSFNDFEAVIDTWQIDWAKTSDANMSIVELTVSPDQKRFNATVSWGDTEKGGFIKKISGKIQKFVTLPVIAVPISQNSSINESDIKYSRFSEEQINQGTILKKEDLIGKSLRSGRVLQTDKPIQVSDVEFPVLIKKGEEVRVNYMDTYFEISIVAIAKNNGRIGEKIAFEVGSDKKKTIQAMVISPGRAEIREVL